MKIAIVTAGGAGMFCGSCMQDNTLARGLRSIGEEAILVPTYTPIRVDEDNVSIDAVFMGGINVYLSSRLPGWRWLPEWATSWLDRPGIVRQLAALGRSTSAADLGAVTLDMLKGNQGPQRREIRRFVRYLVTELRPDVILFSNALLSGVMTELRSQFDGPAVCMLQGDDVFTEALRPKWKQRVLQKMTDNCRLFDGFLVHSRYYRDFMSGYLQIPQQKIQIVPLAVDPSGFDSTPAAPKPAGRYRIGYFARICPEKGVHVLLQAAPAVLEQHPHAEFVIAGYLGGEHADWFQSELNDVQARFPGRVTTAGSPERRDEKIAMLKSLDVLCVPTEYREPKGLYVLEGALAGALPVLPDHGAFPELIASIGDGRLYPAGSIEALQHALAECAATRRKVAEGVGSAIRRKFGMQTAATAVRDAIDHFKTVRPTDETRP